MKAFTEIGIADEVVKAGKIIKSVFIKDPTGKVLTFNDAEELTQRFGVVNNFTIHRADLHEVLSGLLAPGTIEFGKMCVDVDQNSEGVTVNFSDGSATTADY
ncbi:MAG: hypothetical protein WDN75_18925 [Bacteroidota bacterium]